METKLSYKHRLPELNADCGVYEFDLGKYSA